MPPAGLSVRRNGKDAPTAMNNAQPDIVTAAVLVIGDEILSGRTKDKNIGYIAEYLTAIGIDLRKCASSPTTRTTIVAALNALRAALHLCLHHRRHRPDA